MRSDSDHLLQTRVYKRVSRILLGGMFFASVPNCTGLSRNGVDFHAIPKPQRMMLAVIDSFWAAAVRKDTIQLSQLSIGKTPVQWVSRQLTAHATFFKRTQDSLQFQYMYFLHRDPDTTIVQIQVPWVTCKPPYHMGHPDQYYFKLIPSNAGAPSWKIVNVWSEIC